MEDEHTKLNTGLRQQNLCSFQQETGLKFKEDASKVLQLEDSFVWCCKWDTSGSRSEMLGKF